MNRRASFGRRWAALFVSSAVAVASMAVSVGLAPTAAAEPIGVQQRPATMVTAESLPTAQINGVAWAQLIVGNTVFVGGSFTSARPAGSPAGSNEVARTNLMSYNLTTGEMTSWAPVLNQQVKALAVSPDGSTLYVGGQFSTVNGQARYRLAAFDIATGNLSTTFRGGADYIINTIVATADTVYVGGAFSTAYSTPSGGGARNRLAAYSASNGVLLNWAPTADNSVQSMVLAPSGDKIVIAGAFANVNGAVAPGTAALNLTTGASLPWALNTVIKNSGANGAILALSTDGTAIYGGGYKYGGANAGTLEGMFKVDSNGTLQWIEDCHGDTYGVYAGTAAVFQVGHSHYCGNNMGWPQPATWNFNRAIAFTKDTTGTLIREPLGYANFNNTPSPSLQSWFPLLDVGTFTGKSQAAWSVTGNADYVVLGGEFPTVNGTPQQGLARFAVTPIAPGTRGAEYSGANFKPTLSSTQAGTVKISFVANVDRDDRTMTYKIIRDGVSGSPIYTTTVDSSSWERPAIGFTDTGLVPGSTHGYRLQVIDGNNNLTWGDGVNITVASTSASVPGYGQTVLGQGASLYWPLNDSTTSAVDQAGYNPGVTQGGVTAGTAGGINGSTAMTFNGTDGELATAGAQVAPNTFTESVWFKTTSTRGGRIAGFGDLQFDGSGHRDRQIYLNNTGRVSFGVWGAAASALTSANSYNDGNWHQAVASLGASGMQLYVDGVKVGSRADVTSGEKYVGYWRIGGDNVSGFANTGTSGYLAGSIDEFAVFPSVLSTQQVLAQYTAAGRTSPAPADAYGSAVYNDDPTLYWRLGEASAATTAVDSASGVYSGAYSGTTTKAVAGAIAGTTNSAVTFNGSTGLVSSNSTFANPTVYSVEAWVKTTTTSGGKIIGFGNVKTGLSTSYDRHLYMQNDGKVVFGANSAASVITSPTALNDGQWHYLVGTQGAGGMTLYVDGVPVGTNPQVTPASYTGYWRVGGDRTWGSTSSYLAGTVDEPAVYSTVLSAQQVANHFTKAGGLLPNVLPTAVFTHSESKLALSVDGTGSTDSDGTITNWSWNWGDATAAGSGATASHTYAAAGSYTVTLTVTDNRGGTAVRTAPVTVVANVAPVATFTASQQHLTTAVDGSASTDSDGTVAGFSWNWGDGTAAGTGATASHAYAAAGTYTVTLTVTDNNGGTNETSQQVTAVAAPNSAPTASIAKTVNHLDVAFDGTGSSDADGSIASYAWSFGDGATADGATASHTYATAGTYPISLTVTDDQGSTNISTSTVSVAPNVGPTAVVATSSNGSVLSVNGSGSSDSDGTITGYSWDFGDGTPAVTGATASHTYTALGTYPVTLTVTDNDGVSGSATVNVNLQQAYYAQDAFARAVATGWGPADLGGAWTVGTGAPAAAVASGAATLPLNKGATRAASLNGVSQADVDVRFRVSLDQQPAGGALQVTSMVRSSTGNNSYRVTTNFSTSGAVSVSLVKIAAGVSSTLQSRTITGLTYTAGTELAVRFMVSGSATPTVSAKVWPASGSEPSAWTVTSTDMTPNAALQGPGTIALIGYLSGSATNAPITPAFKAFSVQAVN